MPDLLLELLSEEIPARMQRRAAEDLKKLVTGALVDRGLTYEGAKAFATPRRLALTVAGLPAKGRDIREERKGPRLGAPEAAIQGFLKSAGLQDISQAKIEKDAKKGEFYVATIERPGEPTAAVIADVMPKIIRDFPWPKSMRWGAESAPDREGAAALRWVRPLQSILCTFGPETEETEIVPFAVDGLRSADLTRGHRFLAPQPTRVKRFGDYVEKLEKAFVILDLDRRKDIIATDARNLAMAQNLDLVEDEGLLEEVAGLVEWPVVLMGEFEERFLDAPAEVIRATIRANQKCFVLRRLAASPSPLVGEGGPKDREGGAPSAISGAPFPPSPTLPHKGGEGASSLAPRFLLTSNMLASDGGKTIVAGNARVIRARLSDALYFWKTDQGPLPDYVTPENRDRPLDQRLAKLKALNIVFHEKLGTQGDRVERIRALAREQAPIVGADPELAARAAELCKADLVTEVVGEFPETQGLMGRRYAELQGEHPSVCAAVEEHYKPQGPNDSVPTDPVSVAVALADRLDTLVGFWSIDEKPTGSKDPYGLRRAALGVIRLVVENGVRVRLSSILQMWRSYLATWAEKNDRSIVAARRNLPTRNAQPQWGSEWAIVARGHNCVGVGADFLFISSPGIGSLDESDLSGLTGQERKPAFQFRLKGVEIELLSFFHDRLKILLREQGARHDLVDAVLGDPTSPLRGEVDALSASGGGGGGDDPPTPALRADPPSRGEGGANDDLLLIVRRVKALGKFLETDDGKNLLTGWKRAANILRAEEKRDGAGAFDSAPDESLLQADEEKELFAALNDALPRAESAVAQEDFESAMRALSALRAPVDSFFDHVTVNTDDPALRGNRLKLLNRLRAATRPVADFAKISG